MTAESSMTAETFVLAEASTRIPRPTRRHGWCTDSMACVPGALDHFVLGANVEELTVILGALTLREEVAERHALHVILV
jgi:hypothetical protein